MSDNKAIGVLALTISEDDEIRIGENIYIKCRKVQLFGGKRLRIVISAPKEVRIVRGKFFNASEVSGILPNAEIKRRKYKAGQGNEA